MDFDYGQRRRIAVALALTVILVPAAFLLSDGDDGPVALPVGTLVGAPGSSDGDGRDADVRSRSTDPMGTTPLDIIRGTIPERGPDGARIAIPRPSQGLQGTASFRRDITDVAACQIRDLATIPFNSEVTVTNLNNSRSVRCVASVGGVTPEHAVVLHADAFLQIGDLTDAPIAVEISW